tara:strand:+ start:1286 stop:1729 length:444 start_codon:yes stop_codon:yes gene_type:complete
MDREQALKTLQGQKDGKREGFSPIAFGLSTTIAIILAVALIILIILYFRRDSNLINTDECPPALEGLLVQSDKQLNTTATNCGTQTNCTYTVNSVKSAEQICRDLGSLKCAAFTMTQLPSSDQYTMKVSSETGTSIDVGSETYRIVE